MSSFENADRTGGGPADAGYWESGPGPHPGPGSFGAGQSGPDLVTGGGRPVSLGDLLVAAGGLLFFISSFLTWISLDLGLDLGNPCDGLPDPGQRANCEEGLAIQSGSSSNAWDLILTSAAAVIMILLASTALALGLRLIQTTRTRRQGLTAAVVVVDVIVLNFAGTFDFSAASSALFEGALGQLGGDAPPGLSLGLGFWLAIAGLLAANLGVLVAQRMSRRMSQPGG